jgi:predicted metalloprotease with PDZ domain
MTTPFRRLFLQLIVAFSVLSFSIAVSAQQAEPLKSITYQLSMSKPTSHLFEIAIEVELPENSPTASLDFQMAKWSPGRYAVFDFAKNVQQVHAASGICPRNTNSTEGAKRTVCRPAPLPHQRLDDQTWRVDTKGNTALTFTYKVFGNDLSGTFSQLNTRHANFNGGSIFMYIVGHKPDPVKLVIDPPAGWRIVNGRMEQSNQRQWVFPNWDIMIDTPTEIGADWTRDEFEVDGKKYYVVVHSLGDEGGRRPSLVRDIEKIVRAQVAMWGTPELDSYTFLLHFAADDKSGDGMEHLTSTQIIEPGELAERDTYQSVLGTVSHEFFHVWNVKRLRPAELGPWDFTRPLNTRALWVAEGFTNYYGHLMLRRSGLWSEPQFLQREATTITQIENAPGSRLMSADESSLSAPFIDDAPHAQQTNLANTAISYYPKGELIGLVLDLMIRGKSGGRVSLDDVMRTMYDEFYLQGSNSSYYLRGRGYSTDDLLRVASEVAGFDLTDFFQRYTRSVEVLPYDEAFGYVGLRLIREQASEAYNAGISLEWEHPDDVVVGFVRHDSPAEDAGLQHGDEIVTIGGRRVSRDNWLQRLGRYKSGDRVPVTVKRDRATVQTTIVLGAPERFEYRLEEAGNATAAQKELRSAWLRVTVK